MKAKLGRPTIYTKALGEEICDAIAKSTKSIKTLCAENPHWPGHNAIFEWRYKIPTFGDQYAKAKQDQVEALIDECIQIAEEATYETVSQARLKIDTRKWIACKLAPKLYGDKLTLEDKSNATEELQKLKDSIQQCLKPMV